MSVGNVHRVTLKLSKDDYFLGVRAVDTAGNLPNPEVLSTNPRIIRL